MQGFIITIPTKVRVSHSNDFSLLLKKTKLRIFSSLFNADLDKSVLICHWIVRKNKSAAFSFDTTIQQYMYMYTQIRLAENWKKNSSRNKIHSGL